MDLYLSMHAVPGFLLLVSVTAHSHSHSILSIAPAQTFVQPCWESDRGIDPAKNNRFVLFFFYIPQVNFQAEQFLLWQGGGKLVGSRIRRWGWESSMPSWCPNIWLCWLKLIGTQGMSSQNCHFCESTSIVVKPDLQGLLCVPLQLNAAINHAHRTQTNMKTGRSPQAWCRHLQCLHRTTRHPAPSLIDGAEGLSSRLPCEMRPSCRLPGGQTLLHSTVPHHNVVIPPRLSLPCQEHRHPHTTSPC